MPRVFVSHSSLDTEFVEKEIVAPLRRHGVDVWYARDSIATTDEWDRRITAALKDCEWFLVVLSPRAVDSEWVRNEVHWALEHRKDRVVSVLFEDCDPIELHLKLPRIQYIDFRANPEWAREKLLAVWGLRSLAESDRAFREAVTAIRNEEWDAAVSQLNKALAGNPENAEAATLLDYAQRRQAAERERKASAEKPPAPSINRPDPAGERRATAEGPQVLAGARRDFAKVAAVGPSAKIIEQPFPSSYTVLWRPVSQGQKGEEGAPGSHFPVVVTQDVLLRVSQHLSQTPDDEAGGFLIGTRRRCPVTDREYVVVDRCSPAKRADASHGSPDFTAETWVRLAAELQDRFFGRVCVGWYHSHPKAGAFMSLHDATIQHEQFPEPWTTALVVSLGDDTAGFFSSRDGVFDLSEPAEFYELLEPGSRQSVVAWKNYAGVDSLTGRKPRVRTLNTLTAGTMSTHTLGELLRPLTADSAPATPRQSVAPPPLWESVVPAPPSLWLILLVAVLLGLAWAAGMLKFLY